ncbi:MAG: hypothetical protein II784_00755, partial [Oscillospiraceae bacterium]|nr:hypothetical protein [Oscillospiraceae bacterium]
SMVPDRSGIATEAAIAITRSTAITADRMPTNFLLFSFLFLSSSKNAFRLAIKTGLSYNCAERS